MFKMRNSFLTYSIYLVPHHILLSIACKTNIKLAEKYLNRIAKNVLLRRNDIITFNENELREYERYYSRSLTWHGAGRYQYCNGETIDSFQNILTHGGLRLSKDVYSIFITGKPMRSLSATKLRMIARSYADTHGKGANEMNRYGSSLFWPSYYYSRFYLRFFTIDIYRATRHWRSWKKQAANHRGEILWGKKVSTKAKGVWDTFTIGSDIAENYPILYAIKKGVQQHYLPYPYGNFEIRYSIPVPLSNISHIEVPQDKLKEVKNMLLKYKIDLKVFSIELGEFYVSNQKFSTIIGYK